MTPHQQPTHHAGAAPAKKPEPKKGELAIGCGCLLLIVLAIVAAVAAVWPKDDEAKTPTAPYKIVRTEKGLFVAEVDRLPEGDGLRRIFDEIRRAHDDRDGDWHVWINCSTGGTAAADNRLATGRYAVGQLGAANTGLKAGEAEFEPVAGAKCPNGAKNDPRTVSEKYISAPRRKAFLSSLKAVDPVLAANPEKAWSRAASRCYSLYGGASAAEVLKATAAIYDGTVHHGRRASVPAGSPKALKIYKAIRKWICSSKPLQAHWKQLNRG
ncbi:hypothetical protein [Actinocorallia longicatena]|uniref:Uncharacterized protein n=1 Tax=Actinocorallia longicatena TaxID=111803 RepID=A0ABP6QF32_9ACTN